MRRRSTILHLFQSQNWHPVVSECETHQFASSLSSTATLSKSCTTNNLNASASAASNARGKGQAYSNNAKQATSALVFGKDFTCQTFGKDEYGRTIADVILPDGTVRFYQVPKLSRYLYNSEVCLEFIKAQPGAIPPDEADRNNSQRSNHAHPRGHKNGYFLASSKMRLHFADVFRWASFVGLRYH